MAMDDPQLDTESYADTSDYPEQYRTGPSFGERIGASSAPAQPTPQAVQTPPPAPPPIQIDAAKLPAGIMPAPGATPTPTLGQPDIKLPPAKMPSGIMRTGLSPSEVPSPTASSPATTVLPNLMRERTQAAAPIDPKAVDPQTGKPMYRMGWGQRLLGTVANFANGFARNGVAPTYVGPGATNSRFDRDTAMQGKRVASLDTDIGNQEKLAGLQEKGYEDALKQAYEGKIGEVTQEKADTAQKAAESKSQYDQQLAEIKNLATQNQFKEAQDKLDVMSQRYEQMARMGQDNLDLKRQLGEMAIQMKQQQLDNDRAKFATGTDAKSLEDERKQRLAAIENDWKQHPYLNKIFSNKQQEIKAVNDDINSRLQGAGVQTGGAPKAGAPQAKPSAAPPPPAKGFTRIKASDGMMHDIPTGNLAAARKRDPKLQVMK